MKVLCGVFFLFLVLAPGVRAEGSEIVVVGAGTASIDPDSVTITFTINAKKETMEQAAAECARVYEQVIGAFQSAGFSRNDIITGHYGVDRWMDEKGRKPLGYSAVHTLYVSTKELDRVGALIDLILGSGVPTIRDVQYLSTKADSIRRVALSSAVRNARKDAEAMATAAEGKLGALIELTTHYPDNPTFRTDLEYSAMALRSGIVRAMSITPQRYSVRITVLGRWNFIGPNVEMGGGG
jgi:uncharacterized protein YggE